MARGLQVKDNEKLVVYSTKIEQGTKDLMAALVTVGDLDSQRELIESMLASLEADRPQLFAKAQQLLALQGKAAE